MVVHASIRGIPQDVIDGIPNLFGSAPPDGKMVIGTEDTLPKGETKTQAGTRQPLPVEEVTEGGLDLVTE